MQEKVRSSCAVLGHEKNSRTGFLVRSRISSLLRLPFTPSKKNVSCM